MPEQEAIAEVGNPFDDDPALNEAIISLLKKYCWYFSVRKNDPNTRFPGKVYVVQKKVSKRRWWGWPYTEIVDIGHIGFSPRFAQMMQDGQETLPGFKPRYQGLAVSYWGNDIFEQKRLTRDFRRELEEKLDLHSADGEHIWECNSIAEI